ncbi:MAG: glycosyltransferase family 39 protein [Phycisphaerae bacterium]|nr:glycosyltransferase family 39 protein [Phycisphaerae bacterium]
MNRAATHELALLAVILLAGALLRYHRCGIEPVSLDEMWHLALSTGRGSPQMTLPRNELLENLPSITDLADALPWWRIPLNFGEATHPPLHVLLLRAWRELFGSGDLAAQYSSVVASLAAVVLLWLAARESFGPEAGLWSAGIMAAAPTQLYMSQEIRAYSLLVALSGWLLWVTARIIQRGVTRGRLLELALVSLALLMTHYFAAPAVAVVGIYLFLRLRTGQKRQAGGHWRVAIAVGLAGAIFAVAWMPALTRQWQFVVSAGESFLKEPAENAQALALIRFALLPVRLVAEMPLSSAGWVVLGIAWYLLPLVLLKRSAIASLWLAWLAVGTGLLLALDLARSTRHLVFIRYAMLASPALYALSVASFFCLAPWIGRLGSAAVVTFALLMLPTAYTADTPGYDLFRAHLAEQLGPNDVLIIYSGASSELHMESLLLAASRNPALWPRPVVLLTRPADAALSARLSGRRALVLSGPLSQPLDTILPAVVLGQTDVFDRAGRHMATFTRALIGAAGYDRAGSPD